LVIISLPTLGLLFLQNKEIQSIVSEYLTEKLSEKFEGAVSVSAVHYSFFKRIQLYDLYIEDRYGDTLIYSEVCNIRIKKFRPDKKDILIRKLSFENAFLQISVDEEKNNTLKFFIDSFKKDLPPEEKTITHIEKISFIESRFRRVDRYSEPTPSLINFNDLQIGEIDINIEDFLIRYDTTTLKVISASGTEITGFIMESVQLDLSIGKKHLTFSNGNVITPLSRINSPLVDFRFNHPQNFRQVFDSVNINIISENSMVDFIDIEYFFPVVSDLKGSIIVDGDLFGRLGDMQGKDILIDYMDNTRLDFDMRLSGLPEKDSLFMGFNFRELKTNPVEFDHLMNEYNLDSGEISHYFTGLEDIRYRGGFKGFKRDFETTGSIETNLGRINVDLKMQPDSAKTLHFSGKVGSDGFNLGKLVGKESALGGIVFNINVDGDNHEGDVNAIVSGTVDTLGLFGYDYSKIELEGLFSNKKFDGSLFIKDPNIDLMFTGRIDLEKEIPSFDFTVDVANLRPYYLNLRDDDPAYFASFLLKTDLQGGKINEMNGSVHLVNSLFRRSGSQIQLYDIMLTTGNTPDFSFLTLQSDAVVAKLAGTYNLPELPHLLKGIVNEHFELFSDAEPFYDSLTTFTFSADIRESDQITDFFFPKFDLDPGSKINASFTPDHGNHVFLCEGTLPVFGFKQISMQNLNFSAVADTNQLEFLLTGDHLTSQGDLSIQQPELEMVFSNNQNEIKIEWRNDSIPLYSGNFTASGEISGTTEGKSTYSLMVHPSNFFFNNKEFTIPRSDFQILPESVHIDSFLIEGVDQRFLAHGRYSGEPDDSVTFLVQNLNIHLFNELFDKLPIDLQGTMSGSTSIRMESDNLVLTSNLVAENLEINEQSFGTTTFFADWVRSQQQLELKVMTADKTVNGIDIQGIYQPESKQIDFDIQLHEIGMNLLEPYVSDVMGDINGSGNILLHAHGPITSPQLNGTVDLMNVSALVSETQTSYFSNDNIRINNNDLHFQRFRVTDEYGNDLFIEGNVSTNSFSDFFINLTLTANNFNFLNTSRTDNEQFYGDIFASGIFYLNGRPDQLQIRASANTERNTNLKLPLYNPAQIQTTDFITFIQPDETNGIINSLKQQRLNRINLDLELDITSNTSVQLIFDPKVGDIIQASGNGTLKFEIDENGEFSMFGSVMIEDGEYLFTLQNVINKRFRLRPGGKISWNGSPKSAIIDLEAIYETKASTYNLAPVPSDDMKKRIPVHCLLSLQGELEKPTIVPRIVLPTAEPETRSLVQTSIGTEEELMRQFISLLVINNFISSSEFGANPLSGTSSGVAGVTASELLSNQLSNWLSQISNDFDIGVNYRPGDAISSDEVEVALSTQLLNDRIIFTGNLDVLAEEVRTTGGDASNIVGDFDLEFRVTDKISIKAFNRVNDDRIIRPSLYTQGLGLIYRNEFDSVFDLFRKNNPEKSPENEDNMNINDALLREEETRLP
jgi:hypothetical protein